MYLFVFIYIIKCKINNSAFLYLFGKIKGDNDAIYFFYKYAYYILGNDRISLSTFTIRSIV